MRSPGEAGYFLEALLLEGDVAHSEGLYRLNHWAIRLGCDPHADEAKMASLHEMYHGFLNDSTAFGTLIHAAGFLRRSKSDEPAHLSILAALLGYALQVHEVYATYASAFIVGRGRVDPELLDAYPVYQACLDAALRIERSVPNPIIGFQFVQSAARAAMQPDILERFVALPVDGWTTAEIPLEEQPNWRFERLQRRPFLDRVRAEVETWGRRHESPAIRELLAGELRGDADHDRLTREELDPAADAIGAYIFDLCRAELGAAGASCLEYNGHQIHTAAVIACVEAKVPPGPAGGKLQAAAVGSLETDLVGSFGQERLIVFPAPLRGRWDLLEDVPEASWPDLVVGPEPHVLVVCRPWARVAEQYDFGAGGPPPGGPGDVVTAIRQRAIEADGRPTVQFLLLTSPEQIGRLRERLSGSARCLVSSAMSALASRDWSPVWLPVLSGAEPANHSVLIDLDPFTYVRRWNQQREFDTAIAFVTLKEAGRDHQILVLFPNTGDGLLYLAPCSAVVSSALLFQVREMAARGGPFSEDAGFLTDSMTTLTLVLSHLLREEPWFDFLGVNASR